MNMRTLEWAAGRLASVGCAKCSMHMTFALIALFFLSAPLSGVAAPGDGGGPRVQDSALRLRVERSVAVVGEEQKLTAVIRRKAEAGKKTIVVFAVTHNKEDGGIERVLEEKPLAVGRGAEEVVLETNWTPDKGGEYKLVARLESRVGDDGARLAEAAQVVFASRRPWHFHYWAPFPELELVTGGLVTRGRVKAWENNGNLLEYWADRGVIAQRWAGALCEWNYAAKQETHTDKRIARVAQSWNQAYPEWPGIVVDEIGADPKNEVNHHMSRAVAAAKANEPNQYIAVYILGWAGGEGFIEGMKAADLVLSESYLSRSYQKDGVWDYPRHRRYAAALNDGFGGKTVLALSQNRFDGITTPQELRRQLHWTRHTYPEMPGIAFFEGARHLVPSLNRELRGFYINPVLLVKADDKGIVTVRNIGGDHAPARRIKMATGPAGGGEIEVDVPSLDVNEVYSFALVKTGGETLRVRELNARDEAPPADFETSLRPVSEFGPGVYVLGPPMLWDSEPAEHRPGAVDDWPVPGKVVIAGRDLTSHEPYAVEADDKEKKSRLYYDIAKTGGRSFLLSFSLMVNSPITKDTGGEFAVRLDQREGEAWLDLGALSTYSRFAFSNQNSDKKRDFVQELLPLTIREGVPYQYRIHYDSSGYVRVAIHGAAGEKLWDSGRTPVIGPMSFDRISFSAGKMGEWKPEEKAILLSDMKMHGRLTDFALDVYDR